jgi:hypothetical protein
MCITSAAFKARLERMKRLQGVLQVALGGALVALAPLALWGDSTTVHSRFAGVYLSHNVGTSMNLSLGKDGTATVTESPDGSDAKTLFGHWTDMGGQVKVDFDALDGAPAEPSMIFQPEHDGLQAVSWNRAAWGKSSPPPMKKGYKVKQVYWLTQNP